MYEPVDFGGGQGVRWMVYNWLQGRGSILADEMGLGKTLQVGVPPLGWPTARLFYAHDQ